MDGDTEDLQAGSSSRPQIAQAKVRRRAGTALCLSGGGFRAAIFHLGALRRLNEAGALGRIDAICSVSGGSIVAAHLAARIPDWPFPGAVLDGWDSEVAEPFRALVSRNIRTGPILARYLPWNWARPDSRVQALSRNYYRFLTRQQLHELPARPRYVICAAEMTFGVNWVFERTRVGSYLAGYMAPPTAWTVADAVAASSCFPPIFAPLQLEVSPESLRGGSFPQGEERDRLVSDLCLTDGGVYDNLALEPVWNRCATVLVSDGGARLWFDSARSSLQQLQRYTLIIQNQSVSLRKRWLMTHLRTGLLRGAYWGVAGSVGRYRRKDGLVRADLPGYSGRFAKQQIARMRTDLNRFTPAEFDILENHGYLLAEAALAAHLPEWLEGAPPPRAPHPHLLDESTAARHLAHSRPHFSWRRWMSG